jgi:error-prone DNA polymerase
MVHERGGDVDLAHLPADDPEVYRMLQAADTIGVFQVESRAQMATLPRIHPERFYDLVVQVAIIRPGPIVGDMVHPYIRRRRGREPVSYPHPTLEPILERTLGVPLFQEQLLRMAMVTAGFSGTEAEELRRAFGFKRSEARMREVETKLRAGMARQGIAEDAAEQIVHAITAFALYGFPECVVGDTLVTDAGTGLQVRIEDVVTQRVRMERTLACGPDLRVRPRRVLKATSSGLRTVHRLATVEGRAVLATAEHPVLTPGGWRALATLVPGHRVARSTGRQIAWDTVAAVELVGVRPTFDLEVEGDHNFVANGLVVHNSHASSFALLAYASAYLKVHHPAEFYAALLNNQPMGFYHAATIVKDAQRHGVRVLPVDVTCSGWLAVPGDVRTVRLGLRSVKGLRERAAHALVAARAERPFTSPVDARRRAGLDRDEMATLASIGAFASLGGTRRAMLWTVAQSDPGPLFAGGSADPERSPLVEMTADERMVADYGGTGVTIGPHPMALRRRELAAVGVWRAIDLARGRDGTSVRVAGSVIVRQRPGTAKGFVFLSLEDETGIANVIVTPGLFTRYRWVLVAEPFVLVEGILQMQDEVVSVRAQRVHALARAEHVVPSHDFG